MSKFKVGDKVRILNTDYSGYVVGEINEVVRAEGHAVIGLRSKKDGAVLNFFDSEVEAVEPPKPARQVLIIAALPEGGYTVKEPTAFGTSEAPLAAFTHLWEATSFIDRNMK